MNYDTCFVSHRWYLTNCTQSPSVHIFLLSPLLLFFLSFHAFFIVIQLQPSYSLVVPIFYKIRALSSSMLNSVFLFIMFIIYLPCAIKFLLSLLLYFEFFGVRSLSFRTLADVKFIHIYAFCIILSISRFTIQGEVQCSWDTLWHAYISVCDPYAINPLIFS